MVAEMIVAPGTKYGSWIVLGVQGRSATCACKCGAVRILNIEAIASGEAAPSCGCAPLTRQERAAFYEAVRREEEQQENPVLWRKRHRGRKMSGGGYYPDCPRTVAPIGV